MNIKAYRLRLGLTQKQLAERIGKTASYITKVETGKLVPGDDVILSLSAALGVSTDQLQNGDIVEDVDKRTGGAGLPERIKAVRYANQLTQKEFAEKLSVSRNTIYLLEHYKIKPSPALVRGVIEKFAVDEDWLRSGKGAMYSGRVADIYSFLSSHPDVAAQVKRWLNGRGVSGQR